MPEVQNVREMWLAFFPSSFFFILFFFKLSYRRHELKYLQTSYCVIANCRQMVTCQAFEEDICNIRCLTHDGVI